MKHLAIAAAVSLSVPALAQPAPPPPPKPAPAAPAPAPAPPPPAAAATGTAAPAAPPPPGGMMDMSKMGPMARKPSNEGQTKKEIEAFIKAEDALIAAKNWDGMLARVDFPVVMVTDTLAGVPSTDTMTREQYLAQMKPFWDNAPAGASTKHKLSINVLSDSLASVVDDYDMTAGKMKMKARAASFLVKVNGAWRYKMMAEAGWGDSPAPATPAPTAAPAPAAPPPAAPANTGAAGPGKAPPPPPPATGAPAQPGPNRAPPPPPPPMKR